MTEAYNPDFAVTGVRIDPEMPVVVRDTVLEVLEHYCQPAARSEIIKGLTRIKLICRSPNLSANELALQLAIYADELAKYPADGVMRLLRSWKGEWWPSLAELVKEIHPAATERLLWRDALRKAEVGRKPPEPRRPKVAAAIAQARDASFMAVEPPKPRAQEQNEDQRITEALPPEARAAYWDARFAGLEPEAAKTKALAQAKEETANA